MSAKHTPGPWRVVSFTARGSDDGCYVGISSEHHDCLAEVVIRMKDESPSLELLANAHLIAAAPDLLAALRGLDEALCRAGSPLTKEERHEDRKRLIAARAAIATATGETP
jgi:hypothetical protein